MQVKLLKILIFSAALMAGCSSQQGSEAPSSDVQNRVQEENAERTPYIPPPRDGAFVKIVSQASHLEFLQLATGNAIDLMPTNAERGFGFKRPVGTRVPSSYQHFAIRSGSLDLNMLQITAFKGVSVRSKCWSSPVTDENVAWLPSEAIPAQVKIIAEEYGLAEMMIETPLEPGFYVIHDDAMIRAEQPEDVSVFYPFVVTAEKESHAIWLSEADACFSEIFNLFGTDICKSQPPSSHQKQLEQCAMKQRLAYKARGMNLVSLPLTRAEVQAAEKVKAEERPSKGKKKGKKSSKTNVNPVDPVISHLPFAEEYLMRASYLERLSAPDNRANHLRMLKWMDNTQCQTAHELWKIEQHDHLLRLVNLYEMVVEKDIIPRELIQEVLDYYMPGIPADVLERKDRKHDKPNIKVHADAAKEEVHADAAETDLKKAQKSDLEASDDVIKPARPKLMPLEGLAWVPFCNLESEEPSLYAFYEAILYSDDWTVKLVELLGAIHYRRLMDASQKTRRLSKWFKLVDADVPEVFRMRAKTMSFRTEQTELAFGPFIFTAIPSSQVTPWRATFLSQYNAVRACFDKMAFQQPGVFILDQPLNSTILKQEISGVFGDPIDKLRPLPAIDPGVAECILRSFGRLPSTPALSAKQHIKMAISVGLKPTETEVHIR